MKNKVLFLFTVLLSVLLPAQVTESSFSIENLRQHLQYLGSDLFAGRGIGQLGGNLSAKYLALHYDKYKLKPVADNGTYYQQIPMQGSLASINSELLVSNENEKAELTMFIDYVLFKSGDQTFIPTQLPLAFTGYSIIAPEYDYNDYQNIDVHGKIVVALEGEPLSDSDDYFLGEAPTIYSYNESKIRTAMSRGAYGCIIIPNIYGNQFYNWDKFNIQYQFESVRLAYSASSILGMIINPEIVNFIFDGTNFNYNRILKMHSTGNIKSFDLHSKLSFKGKFIEREFFSSNVIGLIKGNNFELKDEYVIVSAHYDHLGIGPSAYKDSVYNGVMDNAIGTAALLELARMVEQNKNDFDRSILFIATTGEENGLLGSGFYTDNPIVPLHKTIAAINIDGLAVFDKFNSIIGSGTKYSTLSENLELVAQNLNLRTQDIPPQFNSYESFNRSDQISFAKAGIPSILTLDGTDYKNQLSEEGIKSLQNYGRFIYHTPFDDLTQKINYSASIQHINFLYHLIKSIANDETPPEWLENSPFIDTRLRTIAEGR